VNGDLGSSWESSREPLIYWSAWELVLSFAGATIVCLLVAAWCDGGVGTY
jgi:hypothetical protein